MQDLFLDLERDLFRRSKQPGRAGNVEEGFIDAEGLDQIREPAENFHHLRGYFNVTLHPRVSFYAAGGAGIASFNQNQSVVGNGMVSATSGWTSSFAVAFGGGLDFRLTRLISLRGEVRDFVSRRGIGLTDGRNHPVFGFGMGFHW